MGVPEREMVPVVYNAAGVKLLHFRHENVGSVCFRMHWHERMELLRIHTGEMKMDFGTSQEIYGKGMLVLVHPSQPHYGICCRAPLEYDTIMFDVRSFINANETSSRYLMSVYEGSTRFMQAADSPEILECVDEITASNPESYGAMRIMGQIYLLFSLLYRDCLLSVSEAGAFDKVTREVIEYMEGNCAEALTEDQLCRRFGYTKPYFCRKFKENTGLSPMKYLNIYRLELACKKLKSGACDIGQVARCCGFPDANYFSRCFKKHFGCPPSFYRRQEKIERPKG